MTFSPLNETVGARIGAYLSSAEDFRKQRKRTNKRLVKLRHDLNVVTRDTKNYREKQRVSGLSAAEYAADERYGLLLLLTAERDVLFALEIKSLLDISGERVASYRALMVSKLKKALAHVQRLVEVSSGAKNGLWKAELYVYAALVHGLFAVNKKRWSAAVHALLVAKCGLDCLAGPVGSGTDEDGFHRALIAELVDTTVDPSLNLAVSQLAEASTSDLRTVARRHVKDTLVGFLVPARALFEELDPESVSDITLSVELIRTVQWRDHEATVYNDEMAFRIMQLTDEKKTNWREFSDANEYDMVLQGWTELLEMHSADIAKNNHDDDPDRVQDRAVLLTYVNYHILFTRVKRDLLLIDQLARTNSVASNRDIVRLYGSISSVVAELRELPGVHNDEDLSESLERLGRFFEAHSAVKVALLYALTGRHPEALKVLSHVQSTVLADAAVLPFYAVDAFPYNITSNSDFAAFKKSLDGSVVRAHVLAQLAHETRKKGASQLVVEAVDTYAFSEDLLGSVVAVSASSTLRPVLSKPVLFDVGFNYINYSAGSVAAPAQVQEPQQADEPKRSGFFGMFGRS